MDFQIAREIVDPLGLYIAALLVPLFWGGVTIGLGLMIRAAVIGDDRDDPAGERERLRAGERAWWEVMIGLGDPDRYVGGWLIQGVKWLLIGSVLRLLWTLAAQ